MTKLAGNYEIDNKLYKVRKTQNSYRVTVCFERQNGYHTGIDWVERTTFRTEQQVKKLLKVA